MRLKEMMRRLRASAPIDGSLFAAPFCFQVSWASATLFIGLRECKRQVLRIHLLLALANFSWGFQTICFNVISILIISTLLKVGTRAANKTFHTMRADYSLAEFCRPPT